MALSERAETRDINPPYYNEDGSYTRLGVKMEISKHIICVPNHESTLELMAKAKGLKIIPRFQEMSPGIAYLCKPDIETHDPPKTHANNSSAGYVIDMHRYKADDGRENIICFTRIPSGKGTSTPAHIHGINPTNNKGVFEHYVKERGEAYIGEGEHRKLMSDYVIVPPYTEHYIEAKEDEGTHLIILIENVEGIKEEDIHIHSANR